MIAYLRGIVADLKETRVIIDVNNIGYQVFISSREAAQMPGIGEEVIIHTYMDVKEDSIHLFGFLDEDDLEMYKQLLTVNGVGPKAALGILSVLTASDIRFAILADDAKTIAKAPGIGAKTAKKLILDLKDKVSLEDAFEKKLEQTQKTAAKGGMNQEKEDAVASLVALGFSSSEALKAVQSSDITDDMDASKILTLALKKIRK